MSHPRAADGSVLSEHAEHLGILTVAATSRPDPRELLDSDEH